MHKNKIFPSRQLHSVYHGTNLLSFLGSNTAQFADLAIFTEEILNEKLNFFCAVKS